jgi:exoribonuclease R
MRQTVQVVHILEFDGKDRYYTAMLQENRVMETVSSNKITDTAENKNNTNFFVSQGHKFVKAVPFDNRIPWILIPVTQLTEWVTIPGYVDTLSLYKVQMTSWDVNSSLPLGVIKSYMGKISDLNILEKLVMEENGLGMHMEDFSDTIKKEILDKVTYYKNTLHLEIAKRRDFRQKDIRIFTIDPSTAKDLDDAIHIRVDRT